MYDSRIRVSTKACQEVPKRTLTASQRSRRPIRRRRGLDPFAYLREVFTRLPTMTNWQVKDLTPEAWAKQQNRANGRAAA